MDKESIPNIDFSALPAQAGVYFFYDRNDTLVYIGKSINIKKRVKQHFSAKDRKSTKIQTNVKRIDFEIMGSELISLLYESELIKIHQPLYNRSQRRTIYQFGLYKVDINGYIGLRIDKISVGKEEITTFTSLHEAKEFLYKITERYHLCQKINGLYKSNGTCFQYQIKECQGACVNIEDITLYNKRVEKFISETTIKKFTQLYELEGRNDTEIGIVYIENGIYKGFGFCSKKSRSDKVKFIIPKEDNKDIRRILRRYIINKNNL